MDKFSIQLHHHGRQRWLCAVSPVHGLAAEGEGIVQAVGLCIDKLENSPEFQLMLGEAYEEVLRRLYECRADILQAAEPSAAAQEALEEGLRAVREGRYREVNIDDFSDC